MTGLRCSELAAIFVGKCRINRSVDSVVRVLVYLKLDPVRITCQKRFFGLNVIIRVSVKGKSLVAILLLGHNVATAIFQNGC